MKKEHINTNKSTLTRPSDVLPYKEIGVYPEAPAMGTVVNRFIDGLGYRYYWATESLTSTDLSFRPIDGARTSLETLEHILDISGFILRIAQGAYNGAITEKEVLNFDQMRYQTLQQLKEASDLMAQKTNEEFSALEIKIKQGEHTFSMPFWNLLNGPISDVLYHVGQVVSFRRTSGNPIHPGVDIFSGKNKE